MTKADKNFAVVLTAAWLGLVVSGFWWFQFKDLRAFASEESVVFFEGARFNQQLVKMVGDIEGLQEKITLVHFWDSECSCNRFNEPHVKQLIDKYADDNIQFVIVARIIEHARKDELLKLAKEIFNHPSVISIIPEDELAFDSLPSMPAVAVLNNKKSLMYFGPYGVGAVCSTENGAFVEKTLQRMFKGTPKKQLNVLAKGCFCASEKKPGTNKQKSI